MLCQHCGSASALEQDGRPVELHMFEKTSGYFCADCAIILQEPHNAALRRSIAERAPQVTDEQLAALPDQMLKYTLNLPIPSLGLRI
jgi:hypothetical protein